MHEDEASSERPPLSKEVIIQTIEEMIKRIEELPPAAQMTSLNHYDLQAVLFLLLSIIKSD